MPVHRRLLAAALLMLVGCGGGGGGGGGGSDPSSSGLTANFIAVQSPTCSLSPDTLAMRKVSALGKNVTIGLQVTDCNASMGIYGVVFDISFDPAIMQCASSNPCAGGTVLGTPLLTSNPHCTCNNVTGEILGTFSKRAPGTNDTVAAGQEDIVQFTMKATHGGLGALSFSNTGSLNGTALVTLSGSSAVALPGLAYYGGSVVAQ